MNQTFNKTPYVNIRHDGSSARGIELKFELLNTADIQQTRAPHGEIGCIISRDDLTYHVEFSSGCTLEVQVVKSDSPLDIHRLTIIACDRDEPFIILIRAVLANRTQPYFMLPATLYGTNNADRGVVANHSMGTGADPKLAYRSDKVNGFFSPHWHFRADHIAVPSVSATFDGRFVAMGIEEAVENDQGDYTYNGIGCWTNDQDGDSISVTIGALDWPGRFVNHFVSPGRVIEPLVKKNAVGMTCRFCLYESHADDRFAYEPFIAAWYDVLHESPREGASLGVAMRDVTDLLIADGISPKTGYFCMLRHLDGIEDSATLLAWAGVLQIARPLMLVSKILGRPDYVDITAEMVDRAVVESINPATGLFFDIHWQGRWQANNWWPGLGQSSLINGHACYMLMKMAEDDPARRAWADAAKSVLERVLPHQRDDGRFPNGFSIDDGTPELYEGFGGCFFVAPLLMVHQLFGHEQAREAAIRAVEHYWQEFSELEWVGTDLDCAGAQDSGSSYALIRALVELHRQTRKPKLLKRIGHVLHYAFTYRFGHNTHHRHPVCDWSSCGSKVTSTHNVHLDAFGGEVLESLRYYLQHADDLYLQNRLKDSLAWARQAYNRTENEYGWGKVGCATEQYFHTYHKYQSHEGDGGIWMAYFPWVAGSLLNAYVVEAMETK